MHLLCSSLWGRFHTHVVPGVWRVSACCRSGVKGEGLMILFAICRAEPGCQWESRRANLPALAALLHPPTDCKHNGSPWYRADCSFIRAKNRSRPGESGSVFCSLMNLLFFFSLSLFAELNGGPGNGADWWAACFYRGSSGIMFPPTTGQSLPCQKSISKKEKKKEEKKKSLIRAF